MANEINSATGTGLMENGMTRENSQLGSGSLELVRPPDGGEDERSEAKPPSGGVSEASATRLDPEVLPRAKRRRFSAKYKLEILQQADACTKAGDLGALLRREGLYHSHLATWRRHRDAGTLAALSPKRRGPKPNLDREIRQRIACLEKENCRLVMELEKAELIIDIQKKIARLFGLDQPKNKLGQKS